MESEMLIIQLKSLKLFIGLNEDIITGEKLLCYQKIDKMVGIVERSRIRRKIK